MAQEKILIIDDDVDVINLVKKSVNPLIKLDFAKDLTEAKLLLSNGNYSLILLDLYIEDSFGIELIENNEIDAKKVIILTGENSTEIEVKGHELGVLDYIKKPFNIRVLRAILDKHMLNALQESETELINGPFTINLINHEVQIKGQKIDLTQKEYEILVLLMQNEGRVFSQEHIFSKLWPDDSDTMLKAVDMHISSLRKKIKPFNETIKNKRSVGYFFKN